MSASSTQFTFRVHPDRQRVQCLVRTTPRSKPVRKSQEVLFIDRVQHFDSGALDDLIFQCGNAEWAKLTRFTHLLDVHATDRPCPVRFSLESTGKILEVCLKVLAVVFPCLAIDACSRALLNRKVRGPQSIDFIDVVQKRREPLLLVLSCCLTYPLECAWRAFPALCPERVTLKRVSLGQPLFLRCLRCRSLGFVRQLHRYCGAVRLPASVHHRRA